MKRKLLGSFMLMLTSFASTAQESPWQYTMGFDYSNGDYGGDPIETSILYVPFTTTYYGDLWKFDATVSHVSVDGAGTVIPGDGLIRGEPQRTEEPVASKESGVGDVWLSASRIVELVPVELFYLEIGAKLKIPTANEDKGLGTGATDYTIQADIFKPVGGATPYFSMAYKIRGEFADNEINNVLALSAGSDFALSDKTHLGLSFDYQEASYYDGDNYLELSAYVSQQLNENWRLMFYGYKGLADGSPDFGAGMQLSYRL